MIGETLRRQSFYAYDYLRGGKIIKHLKDLNHLSKDEQLKQKVIAERLESLLTHSCDTVAFYSQFKGKKLKDFPVLTKQMIKSNEKDFISTSYSSSELIEVKTSGSYGVPFSFWLTQEKKARQLAEVIFYGRWSGYDIGVPHIYSRSIAFKSRLKKWLQNEVYIACEKMDKTFLDKTLQVLLKKKHRVFIVFPTAMALVAEYALQQGYTHSDFALEGIITCSENLTEPQRNIIKKAFKCSVISRYSTEETGVLANECHLAKGFHLNNASYIFEVLDLNEDKPAKPGEVGRIVITDLYSHAMPLIRYEIGDLGVISSEKCSCGFNSLFLKEFSGRTMQIIEDTKGRKLYPTALSILMEDFHFILQYQFIQLEQKKYEMNIIYNNESNLFYDKLLCKLEKWVGEDAEIVINKVSQIEVLPSGKRPYIINRYKKS